MANVFSKNSWVSTDPSAAKQRERLNKEGKLFDNLVMATLNVFILKIDGSIIGSSLQKTCLGGESVLFTAEEISILVPPEMTIKEEIVDTVVEGCETRNLILTQIIPGPGEISLAHNGVLFLDELPEFERRTLDALREPIESGQIHLSRTRAKITYPARFQLVAAMNPSPTGHYQGNHNRCTPEQTLRYLNRLSGPFLDRFDLSLEIPLPPPGILSKTVVPGESSATVKQRVMAARERQFKRQNKLNAWLDSPEIRQFCKLESEDAMWLEGTLIHLGLSIRAWQRLLKVARTIADIDQSDIITRQHLQEAVSYRAIDRLLIHLQKLLT